MHRSSIKSASTVQFLFFLESLIHKSVSSNPTNPKQLPTNKIRAAHWPALTPYPNWGEIEVIGCWRSQELMGAATMFPIPRTNMKPEKMLLDMVPSLPGKSEQGNLDFRDGSCVLQQDACLPASSSIIPIHILVHPPEVCCQKEIDSELSAP